MTTHGEVWLAKAHKRLAGYVRARGWTCGAFVLVSRQWDQYSLCIGDRLGTCTMIYVQMDCDVAQLVDDYGQTVALNAETFDALPELQELAPKPLVSRRQLSLEFPAPQIEW